MGRRTPWDRSLHLGIGTTPSLSGVPGRHAFCIRRPGTLACRSPRGAGHPETSHSWPRPPPPTKTAP
eukprot:4003111-Lingulodinium_polyedra.AAC.1